MVESQDRKRYVAKCSRVFVDDQAQCDGVTPGSVLFHLQMAGLEAQIVDTRSQCLVADLFPAFDLAQRSTIPTISHRH